MQFIKVPFQIRKLDCKTKERKRKTTAKWLLTLQLPTRYTCILLFSGSENGILLSSMVKCLTGNQGVLGQAPLDHLGFFCGSVLGLDSPSLVLVKPRTDINSLSCHCDMNTNQSISQSTNGLKMVSLH